MVGKKALLVLAAAAVAGVLLVGQAVSQEEPRGRRDPEQARQRSEEWRQRAAQRMRESLGATEEEWKVLQPKIEKVQTLQRQSRPGMRGGMRGPRAGRGEEAAAPRERTEARKATDSLRKLLDNKESKPEDIKTALAAFRQAREKVLQDLVKAQKELREAVTVRQEARLVLMGLLV